MIPDDTWRGSESIPFEVKEERLRIKDKKSPGGFREETLQIRFTRRGPVVSGVLRGMKTDRILTLRWAAAESMGPGIGLEELLEAGSAEEISRGLKDLNFIVLNFVFADAEGNIGWRVSGKLPMRTQGDSSLPYVVKDGTDNWKGWIPFEDMPHSLNPARGWVGTCNHMTVTKDYPYYFSSQIAPSYRYRRLKELLSGKGVLSADQHWQFQRDIVNVMARAIAPVMAKALLKHEDTREMGTILAGWDSTDDPGKAAPAIFQQIYLNFLHLALEDELGPELTKSLLRSGYFWQERMQRMVMEDESHWFDNKSTPDKVETRDDLFHGAALSTAKEFEASSGKTPSGWLWGDVHRIQFVNALRRKGFGTTLLGCGPYPMGGSRETLYCAWFDNAAPFEVTVSASLRMVADLGDEDKTIALIAPSSGVLIVPLLNSVSDGRSMVAIGHGGQDRPRRRLEGREAVVQQVDAEVCRSSVGADGLESREIDRAAAANDDVQPVFAAIWAGDCIDAGEVDRAAGRGLNVMATRAAVLSLKPASMFPSVERSSRLPSPVALNSSYVL